MWQRPEVQEVLLAEVVSAQRHGVPRSQSLASSPRSRRGDHGVMPPSAAPNILRTTPPAARGPTHQQVFSSPRTRSRPSRRGTTPRPCRIDPARRTDRRRRPARAPPSSSLTRTARRTTLHRGARCSAAHGLTIQTYVPRIGTTRAGPPGSAGAVDAGTSTSILSIASTALVCWNALSISTLLNSTSWL